MQALECLMTRRSCRSYTDQVPGREIIEQILAAGSVAPSGMGQQSAICIAVTDKALRDKLSKANAAVIGKDIGDPFYGAPVVLVVLAKKDVPTHLYDGTLALGNMLNAAHALGLAGCWIHRAQQVFAQPEFAQIVRDLGFDGEYVGIGNCILGYAKEPLSQAPARSKPFSKII